MLLCLREQRLRSLIHGIIKPYYVTNSQPDCRNDYELRGKGPLCRSGPSNALLRFENGAIGSLESSWILPATEPAGLNSRFDIVGTKGGIYIDNVNKRLAIINEERYYHPDISYWPVLRGRAVGDLREAMRHFLTCLLEDKEPTVGGKEGRQALQLVLAIQESCRTGKVVEIT